ncbi:hypothetical protein CLV78_10596 [Aliiruegeria haliotis]|uniref:Uncharacterized protein n=1 Tax=Aliiruegeria haliotis TaxID=1280846 RepID=A0A2T0RPB5_9RHOB|nr:hypothetical protein [Aliiruegeria haliotis]PRY23044.1 hypothetical protein CLV78_10596 [Aliiruegeria haliotis]
MLRTIAVGSHVSVQGIFVRDAKNGRIIVRVGERLFKGTPISKAA